MSKKNTKAITTKQLIVSSEQILHCIANGNQTVYPVEVSIQRPGGGSSWKAKNQRELLELVNSGKLKNTNMIYLRTFGNHTAVELKRKGALTVKAAWLPELSHRETAAGTDVWRLYRLLVPAKQTGIDRPKRQETCRENLPMAA